MRISNSHTNSKISEIAEGWFLIITHSQPGLYGLEIQNLRFHPAGLNSELPASRKSNLLRLSKSQSNTPAQARQPDQSFHGGIFINSLQRIPTEWTKEFNSSNFENSGGVKLRGVVGGGFCVFCGGTVDADGAGWCGGDGSGVEPFGACLVVGLLGGVALGPGLAPGAVVDLVRAEQCDPGVFVVLVAPGHVLLDVGAGPFEGLERAGAVRAVLHGAELGLGERVVVADAGADVGLGDAQAGEEVLEGSRAHRGS